MLQSGTKKENKEEIKIITRMNLDKILNYFDLHSFFPFFSILLITCKQKIIQREMPPRVIQVAVTI
jgi:hypothetical protein